MSRCLSASSFEKFINADKNSIFGTFCDNYHGDALTKTRDAWRSEISIIKAGMQTKIQMVSGRVVCGYQNIMTARINI